MTGIVFLILRIVLTICLYGFILFIFYYLWNENKRQGIRLSTIKIPPINLEIKYNEKPVNKFFFDIDEISIGRDPTSKCQIDDESISSNHARLSYHHNQWWLEDLVSTNGTFINDQKVTTPIVVITGDVLKCGNHTIKIEITGGNPQLFSGVNGLAE